MLRKYVLSLFLIGSLSLTAMEQEESIPVLQSKKPSSFVRDCYSAFKQPSVIFLTHKGLEALGFGLIGLHPKFTDSDSALTTVSRYGGVALILFVRHEVLAKTVKQIGKMLDRAHEYAQEDGLSSLVTAGKSALYGASALACSTIAISAMPVLDTVGDMLAGGVVSPIILCDTQHASWPDILARGGVVAILLYGVGSYTLDLAKKSVDFQKSESTTLSKKLTTYTRRALYGTSAMLGGAVMVKSLVALTKHFEYLPISAEK